MIVVVQGDNTMNEDPVQYTTPMYPLLGVYVAVRTKAIKCFGTAVPCPKKNTWQAMGTVEVERVKPPPPHK